jgi:uncharacterized FlaG/YvyC family protein
MIDMGVVFVKAIMIREIPAEALLDLEARMEEMTGVLFSKGV